MEVLNSMNKERVGSSALGFLPDNKKRHIEISKVKGVYYHEYQYEDPKFKGRMIDRLGDCIPSQPAYTTWSGLMRCRPNSMFAGRLMEKCGGLPIGEDEKEFTEADANAMKEAEARVQDESENTDVGAKNKEKPWWTYAHNVIGYWTAPEDWLEMIAGRESPTPYSIEGYPKQSFRVSWV